MRNAILHIGSTLQKANLHNRNRHLCWLEKWYTLHCGKNKAIVITEELIVAE